MFENAPLFCYNIIMVTLIAPKRIARGTELVVIPRKEYERLLAVEEKKDLVTEEDVLYWSREAHELKKKGKLPLFRGFLKKEYPRIAQKFNIK